MNDIDQIRLEALLFHIQNAYFLYFGTLLPSRIDSIDLLLKNVTFNNPEFHLMCATKQILGLMASVEHQRGA